MKLKSRIFFSTFIAALIALVLTLAAVMSLMYSNMLDVLMGEVKNQAVYIAEVLQNLERSDDEITQYLTEAGKKGVNRITYMDSQGKVFFDNYASPENMNNHLDRPEVMEAFSDGWGDELRASETIGENTYYYALRLDNDNVLRIASTTKSIWGILGNSAVWLALIVIVVVIAAITVAKILTSAVIKPINNLDLADPIANVTYDELSPLLIRMNKQNDTINAKIDQLSEKGREFAYITENMTEGLVIFGEHGNILTANNSAEKILGNDNVENYLELSRNADYLNAVEAALNGVASNNKLLVDNKIYNMTVNPVVNQDKYGAVLFLVDITDKENSEKMRREFSANVSHELKTPLTSIMGAAEIINNGIAKKEDIPHFAGQIHSEASRLLTLIEDIIKISRLDEDNLKHEFEDVNLQQICEMAISELSTKANDKNVTVRYDGSPIVISGVKSVLHEMIYNLCDNAITYNKPNGTVNIKLFETINKKILVVSDTGVGIENEHHDRVFERFYRADKSHSKETGGTGLGLSIVKHGVILHQGELTLESQVNVGTTITIKF